jgi:hypothetical protein
MKIITTPESPRTNFELWQLVVAGAMFAPFATLLTFRNDCAGVWISNRLELLLSSVAAGTLAAFSCGLVVRFERPLKARRKHAAVVLLGILGSLGLFASGFVIELALKLAGAPRVVMVDSMLFVAILGFWNSFAIFYLDTRRRRRNALATQARLRTLESQIRPHFFFNTLNTVSAFIPDQPDAAQAVLARLAGMFRTMLSASETAIVPLAQELDLTREYLEIEKARFGDRLRYTLPTATEAAGLVIPALTLQPLVENAVRHGISKIAEGGHIRVQLTRSPAAFTLIITNPVEEFRDIDPDGLAKPGHSLQIVADRLRLLYKGKAVVEAEADSDFRITLQIPKEGQCGR